MSDTAHKWMCGVCGFEYSESDGWPEGNIAPGTEWENVPNNWRCPQCGAVKSKFEPADED